MCTHALQYLKDTDRVIYIDEGKIIANGKYEELLENNEKFRIFVNEEKKKEIENS